MNSIETRLSVPTGAHVAKLCTAAASSAGSQPPAAEPTPDSPEIRCLRVLAALSESAEGAALLSAALPEPLAGMSGGSPGTAVELLASFVAARLRTAGSGGAQDRPGPVPLVLEILGRSARLSPDAAVQLLQSGAPLLARQRPILKPASTSSERAREEAPVLNLPTAHRPQRRSFGHR